MVSRRRQTNDLEDLGKRQGHLGAGDGAEYARFGGAVGQPVCGKSKTCGANEREKDADNCGKDLHAIFEFGDGSGEIMQLAGIGCEGDDGRRAPTPPTLDGGTWNIDLGNGTQVALANLLTQSMVIHAAVSSDCDDSGFRHGHASASLKQNSLQARSEFISDYRRVAFAPLPILKVLIHSCGPNYELGTVKLRLAANP